MFLPQIESEVLMTRSEAESAAFVIVMRNVIWRSHVITHVTGLLVCNYMWKGMLHARYVIHVIYALQCFNQS